MTINQEISKVAIASGTHGNEVTGTHLLRRWASDQILFCRERLGGKNRLVRGLELAGSEHTGLLQERSNFISHGH